MGTFDHVGQTYTVRQTDVVYKIAVYTDDGNMSMTIRRIGSREPIVEFHGKYNGNFNNWKAKHQELAMSVYKARHDAEWLSRLYRTTR